MSEVYARIAKDCGKPLLDHIQYWSLQLGLPQSGREGVENDETL